MEQGLNHVTVHAEYTVKNTVTRAGTWSLKDVRIIWRGATTVWGRATESV